MRWEDNHLFIENVHKSSANSYFGLGNKEKGDHLCKQWLEESPDWGWGYIGWADQYRNFAENGNLNLEMAKDILEKALSMKSLNNRVDVLERAISLYNDMRLIIEIDILKNTLLL